jgi:lipoyl(octanoyl) transferase
VSLSASAQPTAECSTTTQSLRVDSLGEVSYAEGLVLQQEAIEAVKGGDRDRLLLLEHPPVITLGRSSSPAHLLESEASLNARGIDVVRVPRGGDVTYHGRGQLVGYLIANLRRRGPVDVHRHLRDLEAALIASAASFGVTPCAMAGRTGVFVETAPGSPDRKLASIGIGVRHWITHHGFALNVDIDLGEFDSIVPCGLRDVDMTSLAREGAGSGPEFAAAVREAVAKEIEAKFGGVAASA